MEAWTELSPRNLGALHGCSRKRLMSPDYSESNMTRPSTPKRYKQSGGNIRLYGPEQVWATPQAVRPASIPISLFDRCHQQISTPLIIRSINGVNQISKISNSPYYTLLLLLNPGPASGFQSRILVSEVERGICTTDKGQILSQH